jgi:hypothetical protein
MVILCANLASNAPHLDMENLVSWLETSSVVADLRVLDDACNSPRAVRDAIEDSVAGRLVVVVCAVDHSE